MIEPVRSGDRLIEEIEATLPASGQLAVWWLGQSGFVIKSARATILVDPYLSESLTLKYAGTNKPHIRMTRCPVAPGQLKKIDVVLCSHKHSDHLDPGTLPALAAASPGCEFVVPASLSDHASNLGLPVGRSIGIDHGEARDFPSLGLHVRGVKAAHEGLDTDERGRHLFLSFVIDLDGSRVFHSGDTMLWPGMAEAIGPGVDLAFLPINGRDPARGVAGNMNADEAVELASRLSPRYVVPHHYDMFTFNTVDPEAFRRASRRLPPAIRPVILRCGERFETDLRHGA